VNAYEQRRLFCDWMREFGRCFLRGTLEETRDLIVEELSKYRKEKGISDDVEIKINLIPEFGGRDQSALPPCGPTEGFSESDLANAPLMTSGAKTRGRKSLDPEQCKFHGYALFLQQ
jgi:hypothetical protein